MRPLAIDLFCGLGGWAEGFLAEGYDVLGFDIERHRYPARVAVELTAKAAGIDWSKGDSFNGTTEKRLRDSPLTGGWAEYPGQLVLQDVLTLHGSQFKHAAAIVASPPCQKYSYMAMPWDRAKREIRWQKWERDSPMGDFHLNDLFDACFRIQREASEAAGHEIPMVVENVKGAQPWVGRARWHYGSFYLWGDVPALMPFTENKRKSKHQPLCETPAGTGASNSVPRASSSQRTRKLGMDDVKVPSENGRRTDPGKGARFTSRDCGVENGTKCGGDWFNDSQPSISRLYSSKSNARKQASAQIAKIPFPLAQHIASVFKP